MCTHKGTAYYIPFGHVTGEKQLSRDEVLRALSPLLLDPNIEKFMHHAKFDELALWHYKQASITLIFDTMLAAQLVTQDWQRINLKALSELYLHEPMLTFAQIVTDKKLKNFAEVPLAASN